jgi:hypothetical protein
MSMRCGLVALAVDAPRCAPVLGTLPAAANTRDPDSTALARSRGGASGRRCDDAINGGVQQTQPRNDNRRADGMERFLLFFLQLEQISPSLIPAKAGIQNVRSDLAALGPRFRWDERRLLRPAKRHGPQAGDLLSLRLGAR